jgi:ribonucleoside-diphosphate reductase alpha chain|tara:strand:+ start:1440 stop:3857 length:2418 start_codon:yes stop_codon:yes gene_type:complete
MHNKTEVRQETLKYFKGDELATNVWMTKYALKNSAGEFVEKSPDEMHRRLSSEFARIEQAFNSERALSEEKIYEYLKDFKYIVPQGSPMMGIGNNYVNVSLSNCVVVESPADNISSIIDSGKSLANLFKRRCGVGLDISDLRPEGTQVNNSAGTTTGAWSFADFYSYVCRMIGQNGRRGALMITMDVRHPDIEKFVTMKHDFLKVTGANVSVKISDSFMHAVENNESFNLHFPIGSDNPTHTKEIQAVELWDSIVESATKTAEPGLLMWDNITKFLPAEEYADEGFKTITTNPCGEIPLSAHDSCRLISINLKSFVNNKFKKSAKFDFVKFSEVAAMAMRLSDDLVELELEKLDTIIEVCDTQDEKELWNKLKTACINGRRTGLGTHGLADALSCLRIAYDSPKANKIMGKIYETLRNSAYLESARLAEERGSFEVFNWEKERGNEFIKSLPDNIQTLISQVGRRNISILTNAPTGSVSILSQTSSGLEPVFRNKYIRRRKLSHNEKNTEPDYIDELGDRWVEYAVFHHNAQQWIDQHSSEELPDFFVESDQIDWMQRIEAQATIQKFIDHSISSTINLPKGTEPGLVSKLYFEAWKRGLKGVTVYVDGSRSGVLLTEGEEQGAFPYHKAPKRPKEMPCMIHHTTIKGEKWTILVGLFHGKPYEIMGGLSTYVEIPKKYTEGILIKHPRKTMNSVYDLRFGTDGDEFSIKDMVKVFDNPNHSAFTRMISLGLRHGASVQYVVEQMQKDRDSDMFSFAKCVSRVLKYYIKDGTMPGDKTCSACSEETLIYVDGCVSCTACGYSKCS